MRVIQWHFETGTQGSDRSGEIEVDDNSTDEEIEAEVREEVFNFVSWGWTEKKPSDPGHE